MGNFAACKIYKSLAAGDPSFRGHVWKSAESAGSTLDCSAAENLLLGLWDPPDSAAMRSGLYLLVPQLPPPFLARGSCPQTPRVPARVHPPKAGRPLRAEQWLPQRSAPDPEELDSWGGVGRSAIPCTPQALGARKANPTAGPAEPPWEQETERRACGTIKGLQRGSDSPYGAKASACRSLWASQGLAHTLASPTRQG